jgi:uroporphyrinogen-III synthase
MDKLLRNRKIIITREKEQAAELVKSLETYGADCLVFPTIKISAPESWTDCDEALLQIDNYDWIIFSSAKGVRYFWNRAREVNTKKYKNKIAVVGKKTLKELESLGLKADLIPETFSAAGLIESFRCEKIKGNRILNPTSEIARDELQVGLENMGAIVDQITVYKNECNQNQSIDHILNAIEQNEIDAVLFFSPSAFNCFIQILGSEICVNLKKSNVVIAAIGSTTASTIEIAGYNVGIIPEEGTQESMVQAVVDYFRETM